MKKNSLTPNQGLSLSQAQSISNLCNQRAGEIDAKLSGVNNYSKTVTIKGASGYEDHLIVRGISMPVNVIDLLIEKAKLHGCQAFLMENIKAKAAMLMTAKNEFADYSSVEVPEKPKSIDVYSKFLPEVNDEWGWEQLTAGDINEYLEAEAYSAHIGQFIHKGSILDNLRKELPTIPAVEWMTIKDGEKTPVKIKIHHNSEGLLALHEDLAKLHRDYEQRVNYFKAKVKNLVTQENARIAKYNADIQIDVEKQNNELFIEYETAYKAAQEKIRTIQSEFEKQRQENIKAIASMRINIDRRFQETINEFLTKLSDIQE